MGAGSFHRSGASLRDQMVNIKENHYKTETKKKNANADKDSFLVNPWGKSVCTIQRLNT